MNSYKELPFQHLETVSKNKKEKKEESKGGREETDGGQIAGLRIQ